MAEQDRCRNMIAVIFIGTSSYIKYFDRFYTSVKTNFFPSEDKHFYVFSDSVPTELKEDVSSIRVDYEGVRGTKLAKFKYIRQILDDLEDYEYIFYLDADNVIREKVEFDLPVLTAVMHPWHHIRKKGRFEKDPKSTAYIENPDGFYYHQSCFWGCSSTLIRDMVETIDTWITLDQAIEHVNEYNICDEIYFNKYLYLHQDLLTSLDTDYANPGDAYERRTGYKFYHDLKIEHENAAQTRTWEELQTSYQLRVGAYYQVAKRTKAVDHALKMFREYYDGQVLIAVDGEEYFDDIADKYNCSQIVFPNQIGTWKNRTESTDQFEWLKRIRMACEHFFLYEDWIVILEPDVETFGPIKRHPQYALNGPKRGPTFTEPLQEYIRQFNKQHFNKHYTGCGGSIFNKHMFLKAYDALTPEHIEKGKQLDDRIGKAEDATISYMFQVTGYPIGGWDDFTGWKDPLKEEFAFAHGNKQYYNEPL